MMSSEKSPGTRGTYLVRKYECRECGANFTRKALDKATSGQRRFCPNCGNSIRGVL